MLRPGDPAPPALPDDAPGHPPSFDAWPYRLRFAIDRPSYAGAVVFDAAVFDDPAAVFDGGAALWAPWSDMGCEVAGAELVAGDPDPTFGAVAVSRVAVTLVNRAGRWSTRAGDGRLVWWPIGRRVRVWAERRDGTAVAWLAAGRVSRWEERADTVEVEVVDWIAQLADRDAELNEPPSYARVTEHVAWAVDNLAPDAAPALADGDYLSYPPIVKTNPEPGHTAADDMHRSAFSSSCHVIAEPSGRCRVLARRWWLADTRPGQPRRWMFDTTGGAGICAGLPDGVDYDDELLATRVVIESTAHGERVAQDDELAAQIGRVYEFRYPFTTRQGLAADVDTAAADVLAARSVNRATVALVVPVWPPADGLPWDDGLPDVLDVRVADTVTVRVTVATMTGPVTVDMPGHVWTVEHDVTADQHVARITCTITVPGG